MQEDYHEFQMKLCLNNKGGKKGGGTTKNVLHTKITLQPLLHHSEPDRLAITDSFIQVSLARDIRQ